MWRPRSSSKSSLPSKSSEESPSPTWSAGSTWPGSSSPSSSSARSSPPGRCRSGPSVRSKNSLRSVSGNGTDVIVVPGLVDLEREFLDFERTQALRRVQTAQARHRCPSVSNDLEPVKIVAVVREGDVQGVPRDNADLGASLRELV